MTTQTRKPTAPRIGEAAAKFYPSVFSTLNGGLTYVADAFPAIYKRTLADLKGTFSRGELMLILDVFNGTALTPQIAGQQIDASISDGIALDGLAAKWEIDGDHLNAKIAVLSIFEAAALEIWANGFWYRQTPEDPLDIDTWVRQLLPEEGR